MPYRDITNALRDPGRISSAPTSHSLRSEWCSSQIMKKNKTMFCCLLRPNMVLDRTGDMTFLSTVAFSWCESDPGLRMSNGSATCSLHGAENFSERQTSLADASGRGVGTQADVPHTNIHTPDRFPSEVYCVFTRWRK